MDSALYLCMCRNVFCLSDQAIQTKQKDHQLTIHLTDLWCTIRGSHSHLVFCSLCLLTQGFDPVCPCLCWLLLGWPTHSPAGLPAPGALSVSPTSLPANSSQQQCTAPSDHLWVNQIICPWRKLFLWRSKVLTFITMFLKIYHILQGQMIPILVI